MARDTWSSETCEHCFACNLVNHGDTDDVTAPDREVFVCWSCGKRALVGADEPSLILECEMDGRSLDEIRDTGWCVDGHKPPMGK